MVGNKCILASLHTLHTDVLVDKFKKIMWNTSLITLNYHPRQTFKCKLLHSSYRLFERGACLILWPRGWVLVQGKPFFIACIELIPGKSFVNLFCFMLKVYEQEVILKSI